MKYRDRGSMKAEFKVEYKDWIEKYEILSEVLMGLDTLYGS